MKKESGRGRLKSPRQMANTTDSVN